jgi:hypothetical protein
MPVLNAIENASKKTKNILFNIFMVFFFAISLVLIFTLL